MSENDKGLLLGFAILKVNKGTTLQQELMA